MKGDNMKLSECDISVKAFVCLKSAGIDTTEQLSKVTNDELIRIRNLGRRTFFSLTII